jgi:hypothetical protein
LNFSIVRTGSDTGFVMGKCLIVSKTDSNKYSEYNQPGFGEVSNLNWTEDQSLIITGQNSISSSGQITFQGGRFNIPSPVTEYVRWQYATQEGNCVRRKIAYGSEVGGGPIAISDFEPCP